jgi:outer membrane biosynthesis protein TonB
MRLLRYAIVLAATAAPLTALAQARQVSAVTNAPATVQTYFDFQVEKPVLARPDNPRPEYPHDFQVRARGGEVEIQFVVDTNGRADMKTFQALNTTDQSVTESVRDVLPTMRFYPAESDGRKVRQLVRQTFRFAPMH